MGNEQKQNLETRFIRKPFIIYVCKNETLFKAQASEISAQRVFLRLKGVKGCKCIRLSIDLGQNLGESPDSSLGDGHKSYCNGS